ncbi:pyridoxal kinase PdxY [Vibrio vulnificus]|nr:pyridoxal kinase PdxY [Vibrio vulnificus]
MRGVISIQSHVVYGHAGNSSAVFPLQRMGLEVFPIHTVQFSNHTQYSEGWTGRAFPANDVYQLLDGMKSISVLDKCDAILSGYQGSAEQCCAIAEFVKQVKLANPKALYICDPVMGDPAKGCVVGEGIAEKLIHTLIPMADIIVPNQFELSQFTNTTILDLNDAVSACKKAMAMGVKIVLVKHLHAISDDKFTMMLGYEGECYIVQRPNLAFAKPLVGVGDLISSLFTAGLLNGLSPLDAFRYCNAASYAVVKKTFDLNEWELQIIAAQDEMVTPNEVFPVGRCVLDNAINYYSF